jgi:hypothetical protein
MFVQGASMVLTRKAAYGIYMDKEAYGGDEHQTKGFLLVMCAQTKFRAANSTVG